MSVLQTSTPTLAIRAQPEGVLRGYASIWDTLDSVGEAVLRGAFAKSLERHRREKTAPAMLWSHEHRSPVGRWLSLQEDERGLAVEGKLNLATASGREALAHIEAGDVTGLSIGFRIPEGGSERRDGVTLLRQIELHEISVVACPR
jgi:HK97 family phage prohead protease